MTRDPDRERYDFDNDPSDVPQGISKESMKDFPFALAVSDARMEDNPLVYVNHAFEEITGYAAANAVGRNCRFLQGEGTAPEARRQIRQAIERREDLTIDLLNYRANGEPFLNRLMVAPLANEDGEVTHFLGLQAERPPDSAVETRAARLDESLREIQHRVKNHLAMLLSLIRLEAKRNDGAQGSLDVLANRVEALNLLYDGLARDEWTDSGTVSLGAYVSRVAGALNMLDGHRDVIVNIEAERLEAGVNAASQVGLLLSELLTNALQHAFDEGERGRVEVRLEQAQDATIALSVSDDGNGLPEGCDWPREGNLGARIVRDLARRLDADLEVESSDDGTTVALAIPHQALVPVG